LGNVLRYFLHENRDLVGIKLKSLI